jgi:hypothetical protein
MATANRIEGIGGVGGTRGVGGGGGRSSGGITGKGGGQVTPIYKQSIPPATVKVVPPKPAFARESANFSESIRIQTITSKGFKKGVANNVNVGTPSKTIKINSNK